MKKNYLIIAFIVFVLITSFGVLTYAQTSATRPFELGASRFCKYPNKCKIVKINKSVKKSR
ncbi:hypothetical protein QUB44_23010, partial [Microcoleus sp. AT3-D2]